MLHPPPRGRHYPVSGVSLAAYISGVGAPTVVFLPGAGLVGLDFLHLHERTAELTTSLLYDRAGTGWSGDISLPRGAVDAAGELRKLLAVAKVPRPFVLVGHSLGGAYARRYAQMFPAEVAGLLLLDPFHEDLYERAPQAARDKLVELNSDEIPEPTAEQLDAGRTTVRQMLAAWPDDVRGALVEHHVKTSWRTGIQESRHLYDVVADELRGGGELPDIPMIVITALGTDATQNAFWSAETLRQINEAKTELHARLAASIPHGQQHIIQDAGHGWLHEERRANVLKAIRDILTNARPRTARPVRCSDQV